MAIIAAGMTSATVIDGSGQMTAVGAIATAATGVKDQARGVARVPTTSGSRECPVAHHRAHHRAHQRAHHRVLQGCPPVLRTSE